MSAHHNLQRGVLTQCTRQQARSQAIGQIASGYYYVDHDQRIEEIAAELTRHEEVVAVGVVALGERIAGTLVRRDFFNLLGRPYGRDVLRNLPVREVMASGPIINYDANLFTIAEQLKEYLQSAEISYFPLADDEGRFRGVFSTHDLLLHLSNMTQADIALARKLQSRLVRERELVVGSTFEFTSHSSTAKGVGGDFCTIINHGDGRWFLSVCDVSGKGVSASIVTSVMWGMSSIYDFSAGIQPFISKLNDYILRTFESERFVTGLFVEIDEHRGELIMCDMGHSHVFVLRGGRFLKLTAGRRNLPIGVVADLTPRLSRFVPVLGDILFVLTDGLVEQENADGEVYQLERVAATLKRTADKPVEAINDAIQDDFQRFRGSQHLNDDVTYGIVKFVPQEVRL